MKNKKYNLYKILIAVIFCGGFGTRMNNGVPGLLKPLIQVAGREILAHVISIYEAQGVSDFILLGGYKIEDLKLFARKNHSSKLNIKVIDTGMGTPTGGRLMQVKNFVNESSFFLTYGDSLANFNIKNCFKLMDNKKANMAISTFKKKLEYGVLAIDNDLILENIYEKTFSVPINAGFYILNKNVFNYIESLNDSFEIDVLPKMIKDKKNVIAVNEVDFWHPMDTPDDKSKLEKIILENFKL